MVTCEDYWMDIFAARHLELWWLLPAFSGLSEKNSVWDMEVINIAENKKFITLYLPQTRKQFSTQRFSGSIFQGEPSNCFYLLNTVLSLLTRSTRLTVWWTLLTSWVRLAWITLLRERSVKVCSGTAQQKHYHSWWIIWGDKVVIIWL